jgi:hypothetical protein
LRNYTLIGVSVRCRLDVDVSAVDVSLDGDNEIDDTVRFIRFLLECSDDDGDDE